MIPDPDYVSDLRDAHYWKLGEGVSLWWAKAGWYVDVSAELTPTSDCFLTIRLGQEAPAALLLLVHNRRTK